jgi:flagellin
MNTSRMANRTQSDISTSLQRLSSGARINNAKDDAAGMAIGERMTSKVRGMSQGIRNINDGVSMLQTAEGAMTEVSNLVQRMRELAVQGANTGSLSYSDRQALQEEVKQLKAEVNRIAKNTSFNEVGLLDGKVKLNNIDGASDEVKIVQALKNSWLEQSETMIETYYGLTTTDRDFTIVLDDTSPTFVGEVSAGLTDAVGGIASDFKMTLNLDYFKNLSDDPANDLIDGSTWSHMDQVIAHEMVHAATFDQTNGFQLSTNNHQWFTEGIADFLMGGDSRVIQHGGIAGVMGQDITPGNWGSSSQEYAKAYLAVRFLHDAAGGYTAGNPAASGIGQVLDELSNNQSLDDAIATATGGAYTDVTTFLTAFDAGGAAALGGGSGDLVDLTNTDNGSVGGFDATGGVGVVFDNKSVVSDSFAGSANPTNFNIIFPFELYENKGPSEYIAFHVGANKDEVIRVGTVSASTEALGIKDVDIAVDATDAITRLDGALDFLNEQRATLGAQQNRLSAAVRVSEVSVESISAARSRIQDADYAAETSQMTRSMIVSQASTAMLSQAQASPQLALQLLNGV